MKWATAVWIVCFVLGAWYKLHAGQTQLSISHGLHTQDFTEDAGRAVEWATYGLL